MANCLVCKKKLGFMEGNKGMCVDCFGLSLTSERTGQPIEYLDEDKARTIQTNIVREAQIEAIMLTTETTPNLNITLRIEIVTAEVAYGMNIFKDLFAAVRDIVGGRSEAVQKTMRDARRTALYELKREAHSVGANAVVGVDLDYVELSAAGSMVMLVASGTAVIISDTKLP